MVLDAAKQMMKAPKRKMTPLTDERGFTFIEIITALIILAILTAIFGMGLTAAMKSYHFSKTNTEHIQKGQLAMARICRELTELIDIKNGAGEQSHYIVYDRMQEVDDLPQKISLGLHFNSGDNRLRLLTDVPENWDQDVDGTLSAGDVLVDGVHNFSLHGYGNGEEWNWGENLENLSTIEIRLELLRPDSPATPQLFSTMVHLRNTNNRGGAAP